MQSSKKSAVKNRISQAIFTGAVGMLFVFAISLFLPKEWLISGKIVVFPSGQPASASANLLPEAGNTAEIIRSRSFQGAYFGDQIVNFAGARVMKNSSIVRVGFRSAESDIQVHEDLIAKIPAEVNDYARDLYGGSPFKYKLASDPEISASPVRPNLLLNAILGFLGGLVLYAIYWIGFANMQPEAGEAETEKEEAVIISPEIKPEKEKESASSTDRIGNGKVEMVGGRPHFVPGKKESAPENLPTIDESISSASDSQEPSDEEVKERLNRLMRGEL